MIRTTPIPLTSRIIPDIPTIDPRLMLAAIVESSDDAIISKDLSGTIISWNSAAERIFGYRADEIIGRSVLTLIPPELQHEEPEILRRLVANERIDHYETERVHKDGHRVFVSLTISPIRDESGKVVGASKIARDVSDRKTADMAKVRLAAIVESSDDAIVAKDLNGTITSWNSAAERIFGYRADEIVGQSVLTLIPSELQHEEPEIIRQLTRGERIDHFETERVHKDGHRVNVSLTISPIHDSSGKVIGASKIARDISQLKRARTAVIASEKLAATARMAATIAHEINNPLEAVTNLAYLVEREPSLPDHIRGYAKLLLSELSRVGDITRKTLAFYREETHSAEVNVVELLQDILDLHEPQLRTLKVRATLRFEECATVWGYGLELRQVFVNLVLNAAESIQAEGEIVIRVRVAGGKVWIAICDNGSGIPKRVRHHIFEPFFSTKLNKGSGLGLWISQGIIHKHGGFIKVRSSTSPNRHGTVFVTALPLCEK